MRNIALYLMFDGAGYHGWQIQKNAITVAGTIEAALSALCSHPVKLKGCGRTDAGVHAEIYCANFKTSSSIPAENFPFALNRLLPRDISVLEAHEKHEGFDARRSCVSKEYTYVIYTAPIRNPFYHKRAHFYPRELSTAAMTEAAQHFVGTHDFVAFRSVGTETKTTIRTVSYCKVERKGKLTLLRMCANGFLYNMARTIAGTLLYVSEGKIAPDDIPMILEKNDRSLAGPTAPPEGLYLTKLEYYCAFPSAQISI